MTSSPKLGLADLGSFKSKLRVTPAMLAPTRTPHQPQAAQRQLGTPLTGTVIIGTVVRIVEDRDFGFAQATIDGTPRRIFFHISNSREVIGTANQPQLTNAFKAHSVTAKPPRPSEIVMIVEETHKGFNATAWGLRPKRNWHDDAIEFDDGFQRFEGGYVSVRSEYGSKPTTRYEGRLADIRMSLDELLIVIIDGEEFKPGSSFGTPCDTVAMCFKLEGSYLDAKTQRSADHYTRKVIIVTNPVTGQQQCVTIQMPTHSSD